MRGNLEFELLLFSIKKKTFEYVSANKILKLFLYKSSERKNNRDMT